MDTKKIISCVNLSHNDTQKILDTYCEFGADKILLWDDCAPSDLQEEKLIKTITLLSAAYDTPIMVYQTYPRFEDIKKIIYAGASCAVVDPFKGGKLETLKEGVARFGEENVIGTLLHCINLISADSFKEIVEYTHCRIWMMTLEQMETLKPCIEENLVKIILCSFDTNIEKIIQIMTDSFIKDLCLMNKDTLSSPIIDLYPIKSTLKANQIPVNILESCIPFSQFKCNSDGLIPVVTQDYKTGKVLMLAYMNEASYNETIRSQRMTYYSRSRQCLWKKGETSGHYQFVKSLDIDCDKDTLLAKVHQIGPACHTGSESCFFTNLVKTEYDDTNPGTILDEIMTTVCDRKEHPKEGSYTNYLFDKGIDKILKKVGEEAAEIIIAAKNPDTSELKYEISDFLYHMIVLMAEKGVTWEEVSKELAKRH